LVTAGATAISANIVFASRCCQDPCRSSQPSAHCASPRTDFATPGTAVCTTQQKRSADYKRYEIHSPVFSHGRSPVFSLRSPVFSRPLPRFLSTCSRIFQKSCKTARANVRNSEMDRGSNPGRTATRTRVTTGPLARGRQCSTHVQKRLDCEAKTSTMRAAGVQGGIADRGPGGRREK
jgi:hypothetical protein